MNKKIQILIGIILLAGTLVSGYSLVNSSKPQNVGGITILMPQQGGTGTSTKPTAGKLLLGNVDGLYDLVATSSLGITSSGTDSTTISATLTTNNSGDIGIDSTTGQFRYNDGTATRTLAYYIQPAISIASSSWSTTGTTTIPLGVAINGETWTGLVCFTDIATTTVDFGDGTNFMNAYTASTAPSLLTLNTNNVYTALEKRYMRLYNFVGTPNNVSCSISKTFTND